MIRASDAYDNNDYGAHNARLGNAENVWAASGSVTTPWIEADIGYPTPVSGVVTQGDGGAGQSDDWVTKLKVSTKLSSDVTGPGIFIKHDNGDDKVCSLN